MTDESAIASLGDAGVNTWDGLAPSEEIRDFLGTARDHFEALFPSRTLLALHDHSDEAQIRTHWDTFVGHGYTSIGLPESAGGIGGFSDGIMLLEESGRALLPLPMMASAAAWHIATSVGIAHDHAPSTPSSVICSSRELSDGDEVAVFDGRIIGEVVVVTEVGSVLAVERRLVSRRTVDPEPVDVTRATATVLLGPTLASTRVPRARRDDVLAPARTCVAADLVGVAARSLDLAVAHAMTREQFGQAIGSFQSVKHLLADVHVAIEGARSLVLGAAAEHARTLDGSGARVLAMLAKASAAEIAARSTALRTQLLGAMGLTFESDNHLAVRRSSQTSSFLGSPRQLFARAAQFAHGKEGAHV